MRHATEAGLWTLSLACLLFLLAPQGVAAQGAAEWWGAQYPTVDQLDAEVMAPVVNTSTPFRQTLREVAEQHAKVADLRRENDVERFDCLQKQAALLYYVGDLNEARKYMKRAAEHARASGHVFEAAMAYVDAALIAKSAGNATAAAFLAHQARTMSSFTFLEEGERDAILARISGISS